MNFKSFAMENARREFDPMHPRGAVFGETVEDCVRAQKQQAERDELVTRYLRKVRADNPPASGEGSR